MRLIENKSVVDSIQSYFNKLKDLSQLLSLEDAEIAEYRKAMSNVFSGFVFNDMIDIKKENVAARFDYNTDLHSIAKNDINNLAVQIAIVKSNRIRQLIAMGDLKTETSSIIKLINTEYSLE